MLRMMEKVMAPASYTNLFLFISGKRRKAGKEGGAVSQLLARALLCSDASLPKVPTYRKRQVLSSSFSYLVTAFSGEHLGRKLLQGLCEVLAGLCQGAGV